MCGMNSVLPNSTGADLTFDYGIGANNRDQLNGIIDIGWDDPDAPVAQQISNIAVRMRQTTEIGRASCRERV